MKKAKMIKKFNDFQINESFSQSKEYNDFLKSKSKGKEFFLNNLEEVSDLDNTIISYYNYIIDSNGHMINVDVSAMAGDIKENYIIKYVIVIEYKMEKEYKTDNFFNVIDDFNIIKLSIEEMIDRCKGEVTLSLNKVLNDVNKISFIIHFDGKLESKDLYNSYKDWSEFEDKEYKIGIEELVELYEKEGIDLNKFLDTQDAGDYKDIGFLTDDGEIYIIAHYNIEKKKFTIDRAEVRESINWYNSVYDDFLNYF